MTHIGMGEILGAKATNEERAQGYQSARIRQTAHSALNTSPKLIAVHFLKVHRRIKNLGPSSSSVTTTYDGAVGDAINAGFTNRTCVTHFPAAQWPTLHSSGR